MTADPNTVKTLLDRLDDFDEFNPSEEAEKQPIGIVVVGSGSDLPSGLVDRLARHGRVLVIDGRHMLHDSGDALLRAMAPVGLVEDCYAIRSGKGKKSRWNRENRWR